MRRSTKRRRRQAESEHSLRPLHRSARESNMQTRIRTSKVLRHLGHLRARLGEQLLTWLTILLTVFTFMIVPLHAAKLIMVSGYSFVIVLIMASCIVGAP